MTPLRPHNRGRLFRDRQCPHHKATTGTIQGSGQISCAGAVLAERKTAKVEIPGKFSFGAGIPIGVPFRSAPSATTAEV
jgi:hypothetical protein